MRSKRFTSIVLQYDTNMQTIFFKTRQRNLRLLLILTVRYWEIMLRIFRVLGSWSIELLCSEAVHDDEHEIEIQRTM